MAIGWNMQWMVSASVLVLAATGSARAQDSREAVSVGDIVVTARRMEERLQDVPISITVFNQQELTNRNIVSSKDLGTYTPSLQANTRFGNENTTFTIRGFTQELRTQPSVAVYFADVVAPRGGGTTQSGDGAGPGSFFDLQNVQVLKGPQGTLFGRNTTGGAVLLVPQKPTGSFEGYIEGSAGNYDMRRVQGVLNVPLNDDVRLRVGFDRQTRDGYLNNISGVGPLDFNDTDYWAARASLVVNLTPNLENYTIASWVRSDTNGSISKVGQCFPASGARLLYGGQMSCDQIAREAGKGYYAVENGHRDPELFLEQWQLINTTTWKATDNLTIKNITSYAQLVNRTQAENFGTYWIIPTGTLNNRPTGTYAGLDLSFARSTYRPNSANQSTFTEELQFQGSLLDNRLQWQAGAYLEVSNPLGDVGGATPANLPCTNVALLQCTDAVGAITGTQGSVGIVTFFRGRTAYRNIAAYTQSTFELTDTLKITGGIRYTRDRSTSTAEKIFYRFPQPNTPVAFCLDTGLVLPDCRLNVSKTTSAPTWVAGLDYKPVDDLLLYGKYSRGYRQGSTNPYGADGFSTFEPEKVDTYELGFKSTFSRALRGTLNVTGFYSSFSNQQLQVGMVSLLGRVQANSAIVNAGKSRMYGVEAEASITPVQGLSINVSYAYLNTKLQQLDPILPKGLYDFVSAIPVVGGDLPFAPRNKVSATANYALPLPDAVGRVSLGATFTHTDSYLVSGVGNAGRIPSVDLLNLNVNWNRIAGSPLDASFFMTNVTNEQYRAGALDQTSSGFVSYILAEPQMYGVKLRYNF